MRLTVIMTHPVQYYSPWFRYITAQCPELELTVLYAIQPSSEQQAVGFGGAFQWDLPLLEGHRHQVIRPGRPGDDLHSGNYRGVDVPALVSAMCETRPDVVLVPGWQSITLVRALCACREQGVPALYRGDTNWLSGRGGWRRLPWILKTRWHLGHYSSWLAVGQRSRDFLRRMGCSSRKVFSSPHCVDNDFFASGAAAHQTSQGRQAARSAFDLKRNDFVVLFVGKLELKKRPLQVIQAMARLQPDTVLIIVGAGPLKEQCRFEARRIGVRVVWAGFLNQTEITRAYAAADCLALPSDAGETWGLVVNEAMATGLPCVVSDHVGCAPDLVTPSQTGEVVPLDDVAGLAHGLEIIRLRRAGGHDYSSACRDRIAHYSYAAATNGLVAACQSVITR